MWILVLFDLPTASAELRRRGACFRRGLLRLGFGMFQKSVYLRWEASPERAECLGRRVLGLAPCEGKVSVLRLSARAWEGLESVLDGVRGKVEVAPEPFLVI